MNHEAESQTITTESRSELDSNSNFQFINNPTRLYILDRLSVSLLLAERITLNMYFNLHLHHEQVIITLLLLCSMELFYISMRLILATSHFLLELILSDAFEIFPNNVIFEKYTQISPQYFGVRRHEVNFQLLRQEKMIHASQPSMNKRVNLTLQSTRHPCTHSQEGILVSLKNSLSFLSIYLYLHDIVSVKRTIKISHYKRIILIRTFF